MKKAMLPALGLALLLSACGGTPAAPTEPTPAPTPTAAVITPAPGTPAPTPTPEPGWWEGVTAADLPAGPGEPAELNGVDCWLMGALGEETALYCGLDGERGGWLLRRGEAVQYFPDPMEALPERAPLIQSGDYDGDGTEELLVIYYATPQAARLHIYEWDGAAWLDRPFGPEIYNPVLLDEIEFQYEPRTATVSCYGSTASYSLGTEEAGRVGLWDSFDGLLFYRVRDAGITAVFGVGADVNGEARYFATVTVQVAYDGEGFALSQFELSATGGV